MRRQLTRSVLALLFLAAVVTAQTCQVPPTCSSSPAVVPTAWYNLTFSTAPTATTPTWTWEASDNVDNGCGFVHRGVAAFGGGTASTGGNFIDLYAPPGVANSSGIAPLPRIIGGQGSGRSSDGTLGWSFEWTYRRGSTAQAGNAKFFAIGAGEARWNIFAGPDGSGVGADFGVYGGNGNYVNGASGIVNIINPVLTTQWYHVVVVVQNLTDSFNSDDGAAWFIWINGALLNYTGRGIYLNSKDIQPVARPLAYLGRSNWNADPYWNGLIDTFRIYDKALTGAQVQSLYQGEMGGCAVPVQSGTINGVVPAPNILPRTATGATNPIYSLTFDSNPCSSGTCSYGWAQVSPNDDPSQQGLHRGILRVNMDGATSHWADLNAVNGPWSVSTTRFPQIGGVPSTAVPGWSFELVLKPNGIVNWGKVFDIGAVRRGQTTCNNDVLLGWDASNAQWQFDVCDANGREYQTGDAFGNIASGAWYHMVVVAQPVTPANGLANYFTYLNGDLYTAEANYPMIADVPRQNAWLARSGWQGGDANFSGEIDMFNVYNVALSDIQISEKAAALVRFTSCSPKPSCSANSATVPRPFYELTFATNPVASQGNPTYTWQDSVATDSSCQYVHRGLATFNAASSQFVNLSESTGPSTGGAAIPRTFGGAGSGSLADGTQGWSFEFTFLSGVQSANAKIWALGAGEARWNIFAGPDGSANAANFGVYDDDGNYNNGASGIVDFVRPISTTQWYHVVAVVQLVSNNASSNEGCAYWIYVNGNLLNYTGKAIYLNSHYILEKTRQMAYLAKSTWQADPYWNGAIDTYRIYDRALTQAQVTSLYQGEMGGCSVNFNSNVGSVSSPPNILPRTADVQVTPFYSLNFATDPRDMTTGIVYNYGWQNTSSGDDSSQRALYRGMVTLDGEKQYIDLGATSGPTSASRTALPVIGGGNKGWTFEIIVKPGTTEYWGKLIDIGSERGNNFGACKNDIAMGWDAGTVQWQFLTCDDAGHEQQTGDAFGNIQSGKWYHFVAVIAPTSTGSELANYFTYVNGQLYTVEANFLYPKAVIRENAWLGRSNWIGNNDANISVELDQFNIYNTAVSDVQVTKLYQQNFLGQTVTWGTNTGNNGGGGGQADSTSSKALSGGAIAGIVIGSVVGALLLLVLCWMFIGCGGRGGKKATTTDYASQRDDSQMQSSRATHHGGEGETSHHDDVELA